MESIPGYDDWKTTPPDDPEPASVCDCCGKYLWEGEPIYLDINGEEDLRILKHAFLNSYFQTGLRNSKGL